MKRCQFVKLDEEYCVCEVCGIKVKGKNPERIYCQCPGRKVPSTIEKARHYLSAVGEHISNGLQTRTDEEVLELLEICEACEFYSNSTCRVCGCRISKSQSAFANKLRMKTQHCPKGKWE